MHLFPMVYSLLSTDKCVFVPVTKQKANRILLRFALHYILLNL